MRHAMILPILLGLVHAFTASAQQKDPRPATAPARRRGPKAGDVVESLEFIVPGSATLYLDELVLYDAGEPIAPATKTE